jgi:hypothetical protein
LVAAFYWLSIGWVGNPLLNLRAQKAAEQCPLSGVKPVRILPVQPLLTVPGEAQVRCTRIAFAFPNVLQLMVKTIIWIQPVWQRIS